MACREENAIRRFVLNECGEEVVVLEFNVGGSPDVNHFCRICSKYLKSNGVLSHTELIFEQSMFRQNVADKVLTLGLLLKRSKTKSTRVCRTCVARIDRLIRDLAAFRKWKEEEEKVDSDVTSAPASSDPSAKRDAPFILPEPLPKKSSTNPPQQTGQGDTQVSDHPRARSPSPPRPLKPLPKKLRTDPLPSQQKRRSVTQVITTYASKSEVKVPSESEAGIIHNIANQNWRTAANLLSTHKELFNEMKLKILVGVNAESQTLSNPYKKCMLWKITPDDLRSFSMDNLISELEHQAPLLWSIFKTITKNNNDKAACAALCIALRGREPRLSALAYHINSIIAHGGMKKAVFNKLSRMAITTSYNQALVKQKEMRSTKTGATCGETSPEFEVPDELLQNSDEKMDNSASLENMT